MTRKIRVVHPSITTCHIDNLKENQGILIVLTDFIITVYHGKIVLLIILDSKFFNIFLNFIHDMFIEECKTLILQVIFI